jgi:hypothetical protein
MPNFYISEILFLTKFAEQKPTNNLKFAEIKDLVVDYLQKKYPRELVSNNNVFWYNSDLQSFKIALAREIIQEAQYSNWDQERIRILVLLNFETARCSSAKCFAQID